MSELRYGVTQRMEQLCTHWQACGDCREVFLRCYSMMTGNMLRALERGEFRDRVWVEALLRRFAEYYFDALDAYEGGSPGTPQVWRTAHEAARSARGGLVQHLLLGVNAHINYDLVLSLVDALHPEWEALSPGARASRYADHCHVNDVIGATIDAVQDELLEPRQPGLALADVLMGPLDEWLVSRLITSWRERVWQNAMSLLALPDEGAREAFRRAIERETEERAAAILGAGRPLSDLRRILA